MRMNRGGFGDEQCARGASPLSIIFKGKIAVNMVLVSPKSRHWTENDPMLEVHATDTDRLKEFRDGHFEGGVRG